MDLGRSVSNRVRQEGRGGVSWLLLLIQTMVVAHDALEAQELSDGLFDARPSPVEGLGETLWPVLRRFAVWE